MGGPLATMQSVTVPVEHFSEEERERLAPHFTNLDRPVFGLVNLPETVKGALFARYSRYQGTLRRLFLDEFADSFPRPGDRGLTRASGPPICTRRIFLGYGDDSVAQLGGAHIACEWTSNLLTKILQRPRLAAYLEQSTRYIAYDDQLDGFGYRYHRDPRFGPQYEAAMTMFETYARLLDGDRVGRRAVPCADDESAAAHKRAVRAKALDLVRGLLPAATLSHVGIYGSGQTYEQLVLHLLAHPLAEARTYGSCSSRSCRKIIPSFVARVPREDRGGRWIEFLRERREAAAGRGGPARARRTGEPARPLLRPCVCFARTAREEELLAALLFESSADGRGRRAARSLPSLGEGARWALRELIGERENRRHRPGRGFETVSTASRSSPTTARSATCSGTAAHVPVAAAVAGSRRRSAARGRGAGVGGVCSAPSRRRAGGAASRGGGPPPRGPRASRAYRTATGSARSRPGAPPHRLPPGVQGHPSYRAVALQMRGCDRRRPPERRRRDDVRRRLDRAPAREAALRDAQ